MNGCTRKQKTDNKIYGAGEIYKRNRKPKASKSQVMKGLQCITKVTGKIKEKGDNGAQKMEAIE